MSEVFHCTSVDAGDAASIAALISQVEEQYGAIDVADYNAASVRQSTLAAQPADTRLTDLAVNIGGALAAAKHVRPKLGVRGEG